MIRHIVGLPYNLTLCASSAATATAAAAGYLQQLLPALQLQQPLQPVHTAAAEPYDDDPQLSRQPSPARQPEAALNSSARQMPPPTAYAVKIIIKAHELKFVKLAATVIQDLVLVNFAPKSRGVLPPGWHHANTGLSWVNLSMPAGCASPPIRRTHYTVISGPHVHKYAREQFARTTHTRVLKVCTNNLSELHWLLDSIRMYNFIGCEISMRISSSSYLLPTSTSEQDAAQVPLLSQHRLRFARLFEAASPAGPSSSTISSRSRSSASSSYAALQQSLRELRDSMDDGLLKQRMHLSVNGSYEKWLQTDPGTRATAAAGSTGATGPQQHLREAVAQQVEDSGTLAGTNGSSEQQDQLQQQQQGGQALLAAVDKALLSMKTEVLDRHKLLPYLMAFFDPDKHKVPPAEWMHALLLFGRHKQQEVEASQQQAALQCYQQYGHHSRAMLLLLLQAWYNAADGAKRQQLVMPDASSLESMLGYRNRQRTQGEQA